MDVQLVLLKALTGMGARTQETQLKPGTVLPARVLAGGAILLAGVRLAATLPPGLQPGAVVRLRVKEATGGRLLVQGVEHAEPHEAAQSAAPASAPVLTFPVELPGGAA